MGYCCLKNNTIFSREVASRLICGDHVHPVGKSMNLCQICQRGTVFVFQFRFWNCADQSSSTLFWDCPCWELDSNAEDRFPIRHWNLSTVHLGRRPLPWLACNVARALVTSLLQRGSMASTSHNLRFTNNCLLYKKDLPSYIFTKCYGEGCVTTLLNVANST